MSMLRAAARALPARGLRRPLSTVAAVPETAPAVPRTIPDEALRFEMRTYIHAGRKLPIPEAHQIGEYKVKLRVCGFPAP